MEHIDAREPNDEPQGVSHVIGNRYRCSIEFAYILPADLEFPNEINQLNNLPKAKKEFPRLGELPSQVLQQVQSAVA